MKRSREEEWEDLCQRSHKGSHPRTGLESKFTSSKAYTSVPRTYVQELKTFNLDPNRLKGIPCGPDAVKPMEGPMYGDARKTIRGLVFEMPDEEQSEFTQSLFAHGNALESQILQWIQQLTGGDVQECGRFDHPFKEWMASTPDGLLFWKGVPWLLELKAPTKRQPVFGKDIEGKWKTSKNGLVFNQDRVEVRHHGDGFCDCQEECPMGESDPWIERSLQWNHLRVFKGVKIPPQYVFQNMMHVECARVPRVLFVQAWGGGPWAPPMIGWTPWEPPQPLHDIMMVYWARLWAMVEEGRRMVRYYMERSDGVGLKRMELTWPAQPLRGRNLIPFPWDEIWRIWVEEELKNISIE